MFLTSWSPPCRWMNYWKRETPSTRPSPPSRPLSTTAGAAAAAAAQVRSPAILPRPTLPSNTGATMERTSPGKNGSIWTWIAPTRRVKPQGKKELLQRRLSFHSWECDGARSEALGRCLCISSHRSLFPGLWCIHACLALLFLFFFGFPTRLSLSLSHCSNNGPVLFGSVEFQWCFSWSGYYSWCLMLTAGRPGGCRRKLHKFKVTFCSRRRWALQILLPSSKPGLVSVV